MVLEYSPQRSCAPSRLNGVSRLVSIEVPLLYLRFAFLHVELLGCASRNILGCRTSLRCTISPARRTAVLCCWCERVAPAHRSPYACAPRLHAADAPKQLNLQQIAQRHASAILGEKSASDDSSHLLRQNPCGNSSTSLVVSYTVGGPNQLVSAQIRLHPLSAEPCRADSTSHPYKPAGPVEHRRPAHCTQPDTHSCTPTLQKPLLQGRTLEGVLAESATPALEHPALAAGSGSWSDVVSPQRVVAVGSEASRPLAGTRCRRDYTADPVFG